MICMLRYENKEGYSYARQCHVDDSIITERKKAKK
jgi:hypothetical protein